MSDLREIIIQLAGADSEAVRRWVMRLYRYGYDGPFSGELIHQYSDPSVAFQVVYEDAEHCGLDMDSLERFQYELRLALAHALADCAKHDRHDPFVLGELIDSISRHGVREGMKTLSALLQSKEMMVQRHHGHLLQALLLEAVASLYDTTPETGNAEDTAERKDFNDSIVGLLVGHGRDPRFASTCLEGIIPINTELGWVCLPAAVVSLVVNGNAYGQHLQRHPVNRFLASVSWQSYFRHFHKSAMEIMDLSGNIDHEKCVRRLIGLRLERVRTPFEIFLYLTREYCSEVDLIRRSDAGIDPSVRLPLNLRGDRDEPECLFRMRARNSGGAWETVIVHLTNEEISCAELVQSELVGHGVSRLRNPGWLREGMNRLSTSELA